MTRVGKVVEQWARGITHEQRCTHEKVTANYCVVDYELVQLADTTRYEYTIYSPADNVSRRYTAPAPKFVYVLHNSGCHMLNYRCCTQ